MNWQKIIKLQTTTHPKQKQRTHLSCRKCLGKGTIKRIKEDGTSESYTCPACGGSGLDKDNKLSSRRAR